MAAILVGMLCSSGKVSKKWLVSIGALVAMLAGAFTCAVDNAYFLCLMRIVNAISMAVVNVAALSYITDLYVDDEKQAKFIGQFNGIGYGLSAVMGVGAGFLTEVSWQTTFQGYWIFLPAVVLCILFLPNVKPAQTTKTVETTAEEESGEEGKKGFGLAFWILLFDYIVFTHIFMVPGYYISVYFAENSVGNSVQVGILNSVCMIASCVGSFAFGIAYKKLASRLSIPAYIITALSMVLWWKVPTLWSSWVVYVITGITYGLIVSYTYTMATQLVPKKKSSTAIGLVRFGYAVGGAITTFIVSWEMSVLKTSSFTPSLSITCLISFLILIPEVILYILIKRSKKAA